RDVASHGLVGEQVNAQLLYLALTSRRFERPVSTVVKGASSSGKSELLNKVLRFFPGSAYLLLTAMSEKWLVHDTEELRHPFPVLSEAAGWTGPFATYALRSLLSEACIRYGTVEPDVTGKFDGRRIERGGPTGLIVTTTALGLHPENETRLLSLFVD